MKKILLALLCMGCIFASCELGNESKNETEEKTGKETGILTIENNSFYAISNVSWNDSSIKTSSGSLTIKSRTSSDNYGAAQVHSGSAYLYFTREGSTVMKLRTRDAITVSGDHTIFKLYDSTMVAEVENESNTGALSAIKPVAKPATPVETSTLSIQNQSSSDLFNVKWQGVAFQSSSNSIPKGNTEKNQVSAGSGYILFQFERKSVTLSARTKDMVTVEEGETTEFIFNDNTVIVDTDNPDNTGTLKDLSPVNTGLSIKNQSFSELLNVQWQGKSFASNTVEDAIPIGNNAQQEVSPDSGYIYFKRKSNPAFARTKEVVTVVEGKTTEFIFTDETLIIEANNPDNTGTLKDMKTSVVFFDDAEGEIQNYGERKNSDYYTGSSAYRHAPYKGTKSIYLGSTNDNNSRLSLTVTLERKGKLSFWFAYCNNYYTSASYIGAISIDGEQKASWSGNYNWSYKEFTLEAGTHEILWTTNHTYSYLSLDNILVAYTE